MDNANNVPTSAFVYTSKEVCTSLGIASSTLRSWCLRLESEGYIFKRDKQLNSGNAEGSRLFFERDITALRMMKNLLDQKYPLDYVVGQISSKYKAMTPPVSDDDGGIVSITVPSAERFSIPLEVQAQLFAEFRAIIKEELRKEVITEVRQEMAAATEAIGELQRQVEINLSERIDDVATGLQDEIRKGQDQTNAQFDQIISQLSRMETHGKKKGLLHRIFKG